MERALFITFVRLLVNIYTEQFANVRWGNSKVSSVCPMRNGVRQGAVLSAIACCYYMENLFKILKLKRSGSEIDGFFLGLLGYSDDNFALAPSISALNDMMRQFLFCPGAEGITGSYKRSIKSMMQRTLANHSYPL